MKMKIVFIGCCLAVLGYVVIPFNTITHYKTHKGVITKIIRKSVYDKGIYFTLGEHKNLFLLPNSYLKPEIIDSGLDSYFELLADLTGDSIVFYAWGSSVEVKDNQQKIIFARPTSFEQWSEMKKDSTGRYLLFH